MFGPSRRELHRALERERHRYDQRERELLDRIMYLTDRPWTLPVHDTEPEPEPDEVLTGALELLPDEWGGYSEIPANDE